MSAPAQRLSKKGAFVGLLEHIDNVFLRAELCDDARWLQGEPYEEDNVGVPEG